MNQTAPDQPDLEPQASAAEPADLAEPSPVDVAAATQAELELLRASADLQAEELARLRSERETLAERLGRAQNEFDQVRKRLRKEAEESGERAIARFVKPLLTVMDDFQRAIEAATDPARFQDFAQGVMMIKANLDGVLASSGIEAVAGEGIFDPAQHEVLAEIERADLPKGSIVEVHRPGYRMGSALIRAAQVVVSRPPA